MAPAGHHGSAPVGDLAWAGMLDALRRADLVEAPLNEQVAGWLLTGTERVVADLGCGAGGMTYALAEVLGRSGRDARLIAVDGEPVLLTETRRRTAGVDGVQVETLRADLAADTGLAPGLADLIWASGVVHHLPDQVAAVRACSAALAAGGRLALAEGGLRPRSLPWDIGLGEPGLETRLDRAQESWLAAMRRDIPGTVVMPHGWPAALRAAGLVGVTSRSFLLDRPAPLPAYAVELIRQRYLGYLDHEDLRARLDPTDEQTLRVLTDLADPIGQRIREELFLLTVRTIHVGRVAADDR